MVTEDYVSLKIAKLLKEKGFDEECQQCYGDYKYPCPTLQMAMKWLREVYGLFVRITEDMTGNIFEWSVYQKNYGCKASTYIEDSYEEACEAAIRYCLENLI